MEIDSAAYYGILLSQEHNDAGEKFLLGVAMKLRSNGDELEAEEVLELGSPAYSLDVRCLIGFALTHHEYFFSAGGLSHVIGHKVIPLLKTVAKHTESLQHESHSQVLRMLGALRVAPK